MSDVTIDGRRYTLTDDARDELTQERKELGECIRTFTLEGETYWRNLFIENDRNSLTDEPMGMYSEGDERAPFFTEAFLYNLLGKDDARSVLSVIRRLSALAGVSYR